MSSSPNCSSIALKAFPMNAASRLSSMNGSRQIICEGVLLKTASGMSPVIWRRLRLMVSMSFCPLGVSR